MLIKFIAKHELFFRRCLSLDKMLFLKAMGLRVGARSYIARSSRWPLQHIKRISIGDDVVVGANTHIGVADEGQNIALTICDGVGIGQNCRIGAVKWVTIGEGTLIADNVVIQDCEHTFQPHTSARNTKIKFKGEVYIGPNCFIGRNSVILGGTFLSANTVVGANSVVKGNYILNDLFEETTLITGMKATIKKKTWNT